MKTPISLKHLADKILNVSDNDNVMTITSDNVSSLNESEKYEKIFTDCMTLLDLTAKPNEWQLISRMLLMLSEHGRAAVIARLGCLSAHSDRDIRREFIDKGYIESVIYLPQHLYAETAINVVMVVFSRQNHCVRMVDARHLFETHRRQNTLSGEHIDTICSLMTGKNDYSEDISSDTLHENDSNLNPLHYLYRPIVENGVPFGSVIKSIARGIQFKASEHQKLLTVENTGIRYITLTQINNGIIDFSKNAQYLVASAIDSSKFIIPPQSLLLSKIGAGGYKCAVMDVLMNEIAVANCNLYVIQIDSAKANPYYIQIFLESDLGQQSLQYFQIGAAIKTISIEDLKKMIIPLPPLDEQNRIAARYQQLTEEYRRLSEQAQKCLDERRRLF